jgi:sugar/nucleoside kinase (ribokinase family)
MPGAFLPARVDYLVVGHLSCDLTPSGPRLGGTAAYAALTARALGLRAGVITAWGGELPLDALDGIQVWQAPCERSTTFENAYGPGGRVQRLLHIAPDLRPEDVPPDWRNIPILHLGPIACEGKAVAAAGFTPALLGLTPQGWLRRRDEAGRVWPGDWPEAAEALPLAGAVVISIEDVGGDEARIESMALASRVLAVTEGPAGVRLYWNGDVRRFQAPPVDEVDATGAGDVFAAAFFFRLYTTRDPWDAARFATRLASFSVARPGLQAVPTPDEIRHSLVEVI